LFEVGTGEGKVLDESQNKLEGGKRGKGKPMESRELLPCSWGIKPTK